MSDIKFDWGTGFAAGADTMTKDETIRLQAQEIERLRYELAERALQIDNLRELVYAVPPTENMTGQTWQEAAYANREEVARLDNLLRTYRLPDEVVDIKVVIELRAEIERLREENALLTKGWQPATPTALLDEIKRLRELLGETYGYIHIPYGASHEDVAEISDVRQRVREALGDE